MLLYCYAQTGLTRAIGTAPPPHKPSALWRGLGMRAGLDLRIGFGNMAINLEPHAGGLLIGVDRPAICNLTEQHDVVVGCVAVVERQAEELAACPQFDSHNIVGHPYPQFDLLRTRLALRDRTRDQLTREQHDGISQVRRETVDLSHVMAGCARGAGIEAQRCFEIWLDGLDGHHAHQLPAPARLKPYLDLSRTTV